MIRKITAIYLADATTTTTKTARGCCDVLIRAAIHAEFDDLLRDFGEQHNFVKIPPTVH